jgi:hypothetical protein
MKTLAVALASTLFVQSSAPALTTAAVAPRALQSMTNPAKVQYVRDYLRGAGLSSLSNVDIVISSDLGSEGNTAGEYIQAGSRGSIDGKVYNTPTIIIYAPAFKSADMLANVVLHEGLHATIDLSSPPEALTSLWTAAKAQLQDRFDFSGVPEGIRSGVIEAVFAGVKGNLEHAYIYQTLLELTTTRHDILGKGYYEARLQEMKVDFDRFWATSESLIAPDGKRYRILPKQASASSLSGSYECVEGESCRPSGTHDRTEAGQQLVEEISPLTIEQQGTLVRMRSTYRQTAMPYTVTNEVGSCSGSGGVTSVTSTGTGRLDGDLAGMDIEADFHSSGQTVRCDPDALSHTMPEQNSHNASHVTLKVLGPGRLSLTDESGKTSTWQRQ